MKKHLVVLIVFLAAIMPLSSSFAKEEEIGKVGSASTKCADRVIYVTKVTVCGAGVSCLRNSLPAAIESRFNGDAVDGKTVNYTATVSVARGRAKNQQRFSLPLGKCSRIDYGGGKSSEGLTVTVTLRPDRCVGPSYIATVDESTKTGGLKDVRMVLKGRPIQLGGVSQNDSTDQTVVRLVETAIEDLASQWGA